MKNEMFIIRGITCTKDPDFDCDLIFYSICSDSGWMEYEAAVYVEDCFDYWQPATMERTNRLYKLLNNNREEFSRIMFKIAGGSSTELYIEQNNAII